MTDKINLEFNISSSGDSVITTIQNHLKNLAKALQSTAKEMLNLQKTDIADSIGHVSMSVNQFAASLSKADGEIKETTDLVKQMEKANASFAKSSEHTQQAWAVLSKEIGNTKSFAVAKADANAYGTAVEKLINQMKALGYSEADLSSKVSYTSSVEAQRAGQLQILGGRIRNVTEEGWKYLTSNKQVRDSLRLLNDSASSYNTTMRKLEKISLNPENFTAASKAANTLGQQVAWADKAYQQLAPSILKVENNISKLAIAYRKVIGESAAWTKDINRAAIVNQSMVSGLDGVTKHVEVTGKGFRILSLEGLKPFVGLSIDAANNLGMLDSSFNKIQNNLKAFQILTGKTDDEIEKLKNDMIDSNSTFEKANVALKEYITGHSGLDPAQKKVAVLAIKYEELLSATDKYALAARKEFEAIQKGSKSLEEAAQKIKNINKERNDEIALAKKNETAYKSLSAQYERLVTAQNQYGEKARKVIEGLKEQGASASVTRSKLVALNNEMGNLDNLTNRLVRSFKTYAMYMISSSILQGVTQSFRVGAAAVIEYDQTIQDLKAITEGTVKEIGQMDETLLKVASSSKFSTKETGEAMRQLGQAGMDASQIIGTIPGIVNLATGAAESLRTTVDLISTTMKVFGIDIDETSRVTDIFANAVVKSRLKIEGLNTAFNYIGPVAKQAGLSLEETTGGLMMLANSGLKASTQATGFRQVLAELMSPSKSFSKAIIEAGFSLDDFNPLMNSFQTIMERLPIVITNSKDAIELFGIRGGAAVSAFVNQGASELTRMTSLLSEPGAAAQMAATQMEGLGNILENIKNKFGVLAITIGKAGFTEIFRSMALSFSTFLTATTEFAQTSGGMLTMQFIGLAGAFTAVGTAVNILWPLISKIGAAFTALRTASLAFIGTPLGITILAIASALGVATYAWNKYTEESKKVVEVENKNIDSLVEVKKAIEEYSTALIEKGKNSKEASTALISLNGKLEDYKKTSSEAKEYVESLSESFSKNNGQLQNASGFVRELSKGIDERLNVSLVASSKAIEDLIEKQRESTEQWRWWGQATGITPLIGYLKDIWLWLDRLGLGMVNDSVLITNAVLGIQPSIDKGIVKPFDNAIEAFSTYKNEVEKGTEEQKNKYNALSSNAENFAKSILKGKDASRLTSDEINVLAKEFSQLNDLGQISEGGIVYYLNEASKAAKSAGEQQTVLGAELAKVFNSVKEENAKIKLVNEESLKQKIAILDEGVAKVKEAYAEEIKAANEARMEKLLEYAGNAEEQEKVEIEHQAILLRLKNQEVSAELALMAEKKREFEVIYKTQLSYVENYYKYQFAILDTNNKSEEQANKDSLNRKLVDIESHYTDAEQIKRYSTDATIESYKNELKIADNYYTQKADLVKKEYDARVALAPVLKDNEKKTNNELKLLSEELVKKQVDNLNERKAKSIEVINAMRSLEKSLTDKIKEEINARRDHAASIEDTIRNLKYKTMTDAQVQEAKTTQAMKLFSEARSALLGGEFEIAKKKAEEAKNAFVDVAGGINKENISASEYARQIGNINDKISVVGKTWDSASEGIITTTQNRVNGANRIADTEIKKLGELDKEITKVNTNFDALGVKKVEVSVTDALDGLGKVNAAIAEIHDRKILVEAELENLDPKVKEANEKLDGIKDKEVSVTINAGIVQSPWMPLTEGLEKAKENIDKTFKFDKMMTDITLKLRADGTGSPEAVDTVLEMIRTALSNIKQLLTDLSNLPVEMIITIKDNEALMESINGIATALAELSKEWTATLYLDVFGLDQLQSAWATWKSFIDSPPDIYREVVVNTIQRTTEEKALGGKAGSSRNHATGDRLPGYGGGDIIDARLEPGEWVIRKEAVRKYGDDFMAMVNGMNLALPAFATGGSVAERIKQMTSSKKKRKTVSSLPARNKEVEKVEEIKEEVKVAERDYGKELRDAAKVKEEAKAKAAEEAKAAEVERKRIESEKKQAAIEKAAEEGYLSQLTPSERAAYDLAEAAKVDPDAAFRKASEDQKKIREENEQRLLDEERAADDQRLKAEVEAYQLKGYLDALTPAEREEYYYNERAKTDPATAYDKANKEQTYKEIENRRRVEEDKLRVEEDKKKAEEDKKKAEEAELKAKVEEAKLKGTLSALSKAELAEYYYNEKAEVDPKTAYDKARKEQLAKAEEAASKVESSSSGSSTLSEEEKANRPKSWKYFASGGYADLTEEEKRQRVADMVNEVNVDDYRRRIEGDSPSSYTRSGDNTVSSYIPITHLATDNSYISKIDTPKDTSTWSENGRANMDTWATSSSDRQAAADKESSKRNKNSGGSDSPKTFTMPSLESLIEPYKSSNSIYDLFKAMNTIANIADFELTNMGMIAQSGGAGTNFLSKTSVLRAPPTAEGYYTSNGDDKPNSQELNFLRYATSSSQLKNFGGSGMVTATSYMAAIERLLNAHKITDDDLVKRKEKSVSSARLADIEKAIRGYSIGGSVKPGFATGGFIGGSSAASQVQRGAKPVTTPQGPSHTVNFNIGGEVHGPFSADGVTAESFVKTLRQHQLRS